MTSVTRAGLGLGWGWAPLAGVWLVGVGLVGLAEASGRGELEVRVVDQGTGQPIAVRMHLTDPRGRAVKPPRAPFWTDHFVFAGRIVLDLPPGRYTFDMERGPEYRVRSGHFLIERGATDNKQVEMHRFVDMKQEGWWSGDLHVQRRLDDLPLLMLAEDLHVAPVITWGSHLGEPPSRAAAEPLLSRFDENRFVHRLAGKDQRAGGTLLYFQLDSPLPLDDLQPEYPSPVEFLKQARQQQAVHVDVGQPTGWDLPVWIASGMADSVGLAHPHLWRDGVLDASAERAGPGLRRRPGQAAKGSPGPGALNEAGGKPRDTLLYPSADGVGRWSQDIYYHLLNCGLRLPPSAGSGSGVYPNPPGYNRIYVHCGEQLTYESWWQGLRAGRVVVTNGPLLRPTVNGELPGHVFHGSEGDLIELDVALQLSLRDRVEYLEIVQDGQVAHQVRLDKWAAAGGRLPPVQFRQSGWMLVRAVAHHGQTYRFASTGPYYVQIGDRPRISRQSAQFFLDWVYQRARRLQLDDPQQHQQVLSYHRAARDFWQKRVDQANAD